MVTDAKLFEYEIGLSFAGKQRDYVERVANELRTRGIRAFFDEYEQADLWGKDLNIHLTDVYQNKCRFCVIFASKDYADKVWPTRELQAAQARAIKQKEEYILPTRFDDTPIPGLLDTVHYIDLAQVSPTYLCDLIVEKLGRNVRRAFLPANLELLFDRLGIEEDPEAQTHARSQAESFLRVLIRMSQIERKVVLSLLRFGCHEDLPDDVHIHVDLLHRHTGIPIDELKLTLGGIRSLGFQCSLRKGKECEADAPEVVLGDSSYFHLDWTDLTDEGLYPALEVASEMVLGVTEHFCEVHGTEPLEQLDFSLLASEGT